MPVYRLLEEMPYDELQRWYAYLEKRPVGWREDDRTSKLLQAAGVKEKPWNLFPSLLRIYKPEDDGNPMTSLKGSVMFANMMAAKGGDKLDL